ncbi:MAG: Na+/H+ antiporter subunit E [Lachnospiraceae bacterium]|nr:Na+/H+ antiporter subunit E [Lachnospiraceae bacterium]
MFILYFVLWLLFVGTITLESCIIGLIVAGAVFWFTVKFMGYSVSLEKQNLKKIPKLIKYIILLIKEIIIANVKVISFILTEKEEICPALVTFKGKAKTDVGKSLYANAITLTPGTITAYLEKDTYVVHALDESLTDGIDDSKLEKIILELEKTEDDR